MLILFHAIGTETLHLMKSTGKIPDWLSPSLLQMRIMQQHDPHYDGLVRCFRSELFNFNYMLLFTVIFTRRR